MALEYDFSSGFSGYLPSPEYWCGEDGLFRQTTKYKTYYGSATTRTCLPYLEVFLQRFNDCVANSMSLAYLIRQLVMRVQGASPLSRHMLYGLARKAAGIQDRDLGCSIFQMARAMHKYGFCTEKHWEYKDDPFTAPPVEAMAYAVDQKDKGTSADFKTHVVTNLVELRAAVDSGIPVVVGGRVDKAFEKNSTADVWRCEGEQVGLHARVVVGYDKARGAMIEMNPWGEGWGCPLHVLLGFASRADFEAAEPELASRCPETQGGFILVDENIYNDPGAVREMVAVDWAPSMSEDNPLV